MIRPLFLAVVLTALLSLQGHAAAPAPDGAPWSASLVAAADGCVPGEPTFGARADAWARDTAQLQADESRWVEHEGALKAETAALARETDDIRNARAALQSRERALVRMRDELARPKPSADGAARRRIALAEQYNGDVAAHNDAVIALNTRLDALDARRRAHAAAQTESAAQRSELDRRRDDLLAAADTLARQMRVAAAQCRSPAAEPVEAPTGQ